LSVNKIKDELLELKAELQEQLKIAKAKNESEDVALTRQTDVGLVSK